jgi:hypothetical protein
MKSIHQHDCNRCIFLGNYYKSDLYICLDSSHPSLSTIICRYGIDGDYSSGLSFVFSSVGLNRGLKMADECGYITGELRKFIMNRQIEWLNYLEKDKEYGEGIKQRWGKRKRYLLKN